MNTRKSSPSLVRIAMRLLLTLACLTVMSCGSSSDGTADNRRTVVTPLGTVIKNVSLVAGQQTKVSLTYSGPPDRDAQVDWNSDS